MAGIYIQVVTGGLRRNYRSYTEKPFLGVMEFLTTAFGFTRRTETDIY